MSADDTTLIDTLRDGAANEQVQMLLDVIERQDREIDALRRRTRRLSKEVQHVRNSVGIDPDGDTDSPHFDRRDQAVLESLAADDPDAVPVKDLRKRYRKLTDIRQDETLKDRVKTLTNYGPFEYKSGSVWHYAPE